MGEGGGGISAFVSVVMQLQLQYDNCEIWYSTIPSPTLSVFGGGGEEGE